MKLKTKLAALFFLICMTSLGKINEDSLLLVIQNATSDTVKCNSWYALARAFASRDPEKSLTYSAKGLELAESMKFAKGIAMFYNQQGLAYRSKNDYEKALNSLLKAAEFNLKLGKEREVELAANYGNIGGIYQKKGQFTDNRNFSMKAVEYYNMAREIFERHDNKNGVAGCHLEMGIIHHDVGNYKESLKEYEFAKKLVEDMNFIFGMKVVYNNMGTTFIKLNEFEKAEALYLKALAIEEKLNDTLGSASIYNNLSNVANGKKNWKRAIEYGEKALGISNKYGLPLEIHSAASHLARAYKNLKQFEKAIYYYELKQQFKDSLVNESSNRQMQELEGKFQNEKKQLEIDNLNKEKQLQQSEIDRQQAETKRQNIQKLAFAVGFILTLILAFIVYRSYSRKKKDHEIIIHQKAIVDDQKKEILDSITYAKRIQEAILPPLKDVHEKFRDSFVLYKPKDIVAGDFYWMESITNKTEELILIAAADCTGHGVPGAMVSVVCHNALTRSVREFGLTDPAAILNKSRELVIETFRKSDKEVKDGMDISLCAITPPPGKEQASANIVQQMGVKLQWAGANNPLWIVRNNGNELEEIKPDKQPVGLYINPKPFTTHSLTLNQGDLIYIATDGYADQFGGSKGKKFKYKPLGELILANRHKPLQEQKVVLENTLEQWRGKLEQVDDICIIGIRA